MMRRYTLLMAAVLMAFTGACAEPEPESYQQAAAAEAAPGDTAPDALSTLSDVEDVLSEEISMSLGLSNPVSGTTPSSYYDSAYVSWSCADPDRVCWQFPPWNCGCEEWQSTWLFYQDEDLDNYHRAATVSVNRWLVREECQIDLGFLGCADWEWKQYAVNPAWQSRINSSRWGKRIYTRTDCNDNNSSIRPYVQERCNGTDYDCDYGPYNAGTGYYDSYVTPGTYCAQSVTGPDGIGSCNQSGAWQCTGTYTDACVLGTNPRTLYRDADNDGYGNSGYARSWSYSCTPSGWTTTSGDCNDSNNAIRPGATEVCDGVDNNCVSGIDEGNPGGGASCTVSGQLGECASGVTFCPTGPGGLTCQQVTFSVPESCSNPGQDNDCDGDLDDIPGLGQACNVGDTDSCNDGIQACVGAGVACVNRGPLAAWDFRVDDDANAVDAAEGISPGVLRASGTPTTFAPTWSSSGVSGGSLEFAGTGVVYQNGPELRATVPQISNREGSVEMWLNPDFNPGTAQEYGMFQTDIGINSNNWISVLRWSNNYIYFRMGSSSNPYQDLLINSGLLTPNVWSHWVFTWSEEGNFMRAYRNGVLVGQKTTGLTWNRPAPSTMVRFGRGHEASFDGHMDEMAVYGYPLTTAEAMARYTAGSLTQGASVGDNPAGQNFEYCDGFDNDCTGTTADGASDPRLGVSDVCDAPGDADQCEDDFYVCTAGGLACQNDATDDATFVEVCDGADNNCDGVIDEGVQPIFYFDDDGDTYGDPSVTIQAPGVCTAPAGYVTRAGDCNDADAAINPDATESCDGVDNNCDMAVDETPMAGWGTCSTNYPSLMCQAGAQSCQEGALVCEPDFPEFGDLDTITVPAGTLSRDSGLVGVGSRLMTADAQYAYSIAYSTGSGVVYDGWRYRVYDPRDGWALVDDVVVPGTSYYTDGVMSDGTYLYPMQWTGSGAQSVVRIRIADGFVQDLGHTVAAPYISGQIDTRSGRAFIGTLRFGAMVSRYDASTGWQPPALREAEFAADYPGAVPNGGIGALATDGTYLFGQRWGSSAYPGPPGLWRGGTGLDGTTAGEFEGYVVPQSSLTDSATTFVFDGHYYMPGSSLNTVDRVRVSPAEAEVCDGADNDCDGVADEPGAGGCTVYYLDADRDGYGDGSDSQCLCAAVGNYDSLTGDDCDDTLPSVNPAGTELTADGLDSNCDALEVCYVDADQDFYRRSDDATVLTAELTCPWASGLALASVDGGDCNDSDAAIHPGAPEPCDYIDNDCDNVVDQNFPTVGDLCVSASDTSLCTNAYLVCNGAGNGVICSDSAVSVFDFDEGAGLTAFDGGANDEDLTLQGAATFSSIAREGTSLEFDGVDSYATGATFGHWSSENAFTFSTWFRARDVSGTPYIAASQNVGGPGWRWRLVLDAGVPTFEIFDGATQTVAAPFAVAANSWVHVAVSVRKSADIVLYINGVEVADGAVGSFGPIGQATLGAQTDAVWPSNFFNGFIDELVLLPAALDADSVMDLFTTGALPADFVIEEFCDGLDNDCNGTADDAAALADLGTQCDGIDDDSCEDGVFVCGETRSGAECRSFAPIAFYGMDEASGVAIYNSAGGAGGVSGDGTLGLASVRVAGLRGGGVNLGGTQDIVVPDSTLLDTPTDALTLTAWVNVTGFSPGTRIVAGKGGSYMLGVDGAGTLRCGVATSTATFAWHGAGTLTLGNWHHIACTLSQDGLLRTYLDGVLTDTSPYIGGVLTDLPTSFVIGRSSTGQNFNGLVDEVGLWQVALDASDVNAAMTNGATGVYGPLALGGLHREMCDGADNNCDGVTDETFFHIDTQGDFAALGDACDGTDTDACTEGTVLCAADQFTAFCSDATSNDIETCDGIDNDCRNGIDDGLSFQNYYPDLDGDGQGDGYRVETLCDPPTTGVWVSNGIDCSDTNAAVRQGGAEICDGLDNDCDGTVDDGVLPGVGDACTASAPGACASGQQFCAGGTYYPLVSDAVHGDGFIGDWLMVGPWPWSPPDPANVCTLDPPVMGDEPITDTPQIGDVVNGYGWFDHHTLTNGFGTCNGNFGVDVDRFAVDHPPFPASAAFHYVYGMTYVHSPSTRVVDLAVGYDDAARIWLNGVEVLANTDCDCHITDETIIEDVTLQAGENRLLVQVVNQTAEFGFVARFLDADDGLPVQDLFVAIEPGGAMECDPNAPAPENPCNGIDDNCDGFLDVGEMDLDGDGQWACNGDCQPLDPDTYLGAPELCDYRDNDCDGVADDSLGVGTYCDGALDSDLCQDGKVLCELASGMTYCSGGAAAILTFEAAGQPGLDSSGNGDASVDGAPIVDPSNAQRGRNGVLFADAVSALRIPNAQAQGHEFTFAAWVNPSLSGPRAIVSRLESGGGNGLLLGTSTWLDFLGVRYDNAVPALPVGQWSHVAVVYNTQTLTLYRNGVIVGAPHPVAPLAPGLPGPAPAWESDVFVGQELDPTGVALPGCTNACSVDPGEAFVGAMDDVVWYRHPLTQTEIFGLMAGVPGQDINREFCDFRDNDCNGGSDETFSLGAACDGADDDQCEESVTTCSADGVSTECSYGASAIYTFDRTYNSLGTTFVEDFSGDSNDASLGAGAVVGQVSTRTAVSFDETIDGFVLVPLPNGDRSTFTLSFAARTDASLLTSRVIANRMTSHEQAQGCTGNGFSLLDNGQLYYQCQRLRVDGLGLLLHNAGPWVEITIVHDGTGLEVYVDGTLSNISERVGPTWFSHGSRFDTTTLPSVVWVSDLVFGQRQGVPGGGFSASRSWDGQIDSVVWIDTPPTTADLDDLLAGELPEASTNFELCDMNDNDCSGLADEPYLSPTITDGLGDACVGGLGECAQTGVFACGTDRLSTVCDAVELPPSAEICDGFDNDCDGLVDGMTQSCTNSCGAGVETCIAGVFQGCTAPVIGAEVCDGVDNDCNGDIDEGFTTYTCGMGICEQTLDACIAGAPEVCDPFLGAEPAEVCDALDRDCDGDPTNGFPVGEACYDGLGACESEGVWVCDPGTGGVLCDATGSTPALFDYCGDNQDNDCDGEFDEDMTIATMTVTEIAIGDPNFDYAGRCGINAGAAPRCGAIVFELVNTGPALFVGDVPLELYADDGSGPVLISDGEVLSATMAVGGAPQEFVYCWENATELEDAILSVSLASTCMSVTGTAVTPVDLLVCSDPDVCDGIDNDVDGTVDELPEACGGDPRQVCLYDDIVGEYICAIASEEEGACVDGICPMGERCVDEQCVEGCVDDAQCGAGAACEDGLCAIAPWSSAAPAAAAEETDAAESGAQAGCAAGAGLPVPWFVFFGVTLFGARRRRR